MHIIRPVTSMRFARFCMAVGTLSGIAAFGLGGQTAWADATCTPPANGPAGPAAATFTYQCSGTYTGDWTNTYYVYDPSTGAQTALYTPDYKYDCTAGTWTKGEWDYDAASGAYTENWIAATAPPDQPTNCPVLASPSTAAPAAVPDTSAPAPTPEPGASNSTANNSGSTTLNNGVNSQSQSGDASVTNNGTAGNATSGSATTEVDVANLVQTLSNVLGSGALTFTTNIDGTVNGDLVLDPSTILANAGSTGSGGSSTNAIGTTSSSAAINNDISASATSGDASVVGNGDAGDATTGDAEAIVNLINMINSAVAAGESFIGTININGDLNGNILIPQSIIDELLSSNAAAGNESIINNINANATSGGATVANNGTAGNATSGNAGTNVTIMNLTGSSIIGKNVLLVFVNVLGQWVGMIVNAPAGATSAEFGGGITSATPSTGSSVVEADANLSITNNVDASAQSGNALVAYNDNAGNATSGNAETAVNILNVEDSVLSLANWFGVLFINVFGTWNGSFGIQPTPVPSAPSVGNPSGGSSAHTGTATAYGSAHRFAAFVSDDAGTTDSSADPSVTDASAILGDTVSSPTEHRLDNSSLPTSESGEHANYLLPALGLFFALLLLAGAERDRFLRHKG